MKLISFVSFKGGAGKTTALMAIASNLVGRGEKIALLEGDENAPLARWQENAKGIDTWSDRITVMPADTEASLEKSFATAEATGCSYALVDTAGGGSELNMMVMANSDAIVIPTGLSVLDLDDALSTLDFATRLSQTTDQPLRRRILFTRFPQSRLKAAEQANLAAMAEVPQLTARLTERGALADMKATGLLHAYHEMLRANPARRLLARHFETALAEVKAVTDELLDVVRA